MKEKIIIGLFILMLSLVGCTTKVIIEEEEIIEPVFIEKTITNVSLVMFNIRCYDIDDELIKTNYSYYLDVYDEYITNKIEREWLKKEIHYPIVSFYIYDDGYKTDINKCYCYGKVRIKIDSSADGEYSDICYYDSQDNYDDLRVSDCSYEFERRIDECLKEIE